MATLLDSTVLAEDFWETFIGKKNQKERMSKAK